MPQTPLQQSFNLAIQHHREGRLQQAEQIYRQILNADPHNANALHFLGLLAHQAGQSDAGVDLIHRAIALGLSTPDVFGNLGNALRGAGRLDEAIAAFRQSLALDPNLTPTFINLGNALQAKGDFDQAIAVFRQAIALDPKFAEAHNSLAIALTGKGQLDEAIAACQAAIALRPAYTDAYVNLGNAHKQQGELDPAIATYRQATALDPNVAEVHSNLGSALKDQGLADEALAEYRQAARLDPADARHGSNLVLLLQYHPGFNARSIAEENERWNRQYALPPAKFIRPHSNDRDPDRRLRIGYVSSDFRDHVVGRNLLPLFSRHDHGQFEITCYAQVSSLDAISRQFQNLADSWRCIVGVPDEQLANQIRDDRIDILVDLALHTSGNRLLLFARKPAPLQVTFAGYPGSTGLTAIDYRLSDPYLDPAGMDESIYSERTIRLSDSFWCYDPLDCRDIATTPLPVLRNGFITFGCLNNFCKVNQGVLALWASVLRQTANSRLLLLTPPHSPRSRTLEILQREGIDPRRIEFVSNLSRQAYLETYNRIDIGLDTFPYNGHTTSLDSLWMGVPVVTLVGDRAVSRAGWSQLSNLALVDLAAHTPEQFTSIAVGLAEDLRRLSQMHDNLRRRMEQSPLMDARKFARNIEAAYRSMWKTWCDADDDT